MANMFRFYKTGNDLNPDGTRFHGFTYTVYENGKMGRLGKVRVAYKPGLNSGGAKAWASRSPWQFKMEGATEWDKRQFSQRATAARVLRAQPAPEPAKTEPTTYPGYPRTRWCPNGHGSHVFATPTEASLATKCPTCKAGLVDAKPREKSKFIDLPDLPKVAHEKLAAVVSALQAGRHVYMAGTPGTGKSHMAPQAAELLDIPYYNLSCDSSMTRSTFFGFIDASGEYHRTKMRDAIEHGGVFLLDEIDNGNPSLIAALNSSMSNRWVAFPDAMVEVHPDFRVIATANTWGNGPTAEFVGRLRVDPATLDRFVRVYVGIDERLESDLVSEVAGDASVAERVLKAVRNIRKRVDSEGIRIIVSPRASVQVASLVARGWAMADAIMTTSVGTLDPAKAANLIGGE